MKPFFLFKTKVWRRLLKQRGTGELLFVVLCGLWRVGCGNGLMGLGFNCRAGIARLWEIVGDCGRLWEILGDCGRLWEIVYSSGCLGPRLWEIV